MISARTVSVKRGRVMLDAPIIMKERGERMKIQIDANGVWYYGAPKKLTVLRTGSMIIQ